jgi:hypothetical protein
VDEDGSNRIDGMRYGFQTPPSMKIVQIQNKPHRKIDKDTLGKII